MAYYNSRRGTRRQGMAVRTLVAMALGTLLLMLSAGPASAAFGVRDGSLTTSLPTKAAGATNDFTMSFAFNEDTPGSPDGTARQIEATLPPGFIGDPGAADQCTMTLVVSAAFTPCPRGTAIGEVEAVTEAGGGPATYRTQLFNIQPYEDQVAAFGANPGVAFRLDVELDPSGNYAVKATVPDLNGTVPVISVRVTLWGVPVDHQGPGGITDSMSNRDYGGPGDGQRRAFFRNATRCDDTSTVSVRATSWENPSAWSSQSVPVEALTNCDAVSFDPSVTVRPDSSAPGAPAGYTIDLDVPQATSPDARATAHVKDVTVVMPEGVTLSPSVADGLGACTTAQVGLGSRSAPACPESSKIGRLAITTPVLDDPLTGDVYIGEPLPGNRYRMFLAVEGRGERVKLEGRITPDQQTGQITATFVQNPQLPFSNLRMELNGGPRAPLANPTTCGPKTTTSTITSWAGHTVSPSDTFQISGCPARTFVPTWSVGTTNPTAGADTGFTMRVTRNDNDHEIHSIAADLPPGLLGRISKVPLCSSARAAAGSCGAESQIGTTTVGAGPGSQPLFLKGRVYLTEGYKGAPYGMAFVVPAIAGPYDLGLVNVRAAITVNRTTAELSVASDPLPRILDGIPLRIKDIRIDVDRPGFMFNPTSCAPMQILGKVTSTVSIAANVADRFQVGSCAALPLAPQLDMTLDGKGETRDGDHPALRAFLTQTQGQANLRKAEVKLPLSLALDPDNAQALCKPEQAAARACPPGSIVGNATAVTPVLNRPLSGPVYFVEGIRRTATGQIRRTLPKLWIPLKGEVELDLNADTDVEDDQLVTSFPTIPDAPISSFELNIAGGKNGVIVVSNADVCAGNQQATGDYTGQSGKVVRDLAAQITPMNCPLRVAKTVQSGSSVKLTVGGMRMGGRLSASGSAVQTTRRTLKTANAATLTVPLKESARRQLRRNKRLKVRVSVAYTAAPGQKAKRMRKTVTLKWPAPSASSSAKRR